MRLMLFAALVTAVTSGGIIKHVTSPGAVRSDNSRDRDCPTDVTELPDECPVLIGQIPLESLIVSSTCGVDASSATPPTAVSRSSNCIDRSI